MQQSRVTCKITMLGISWLFQNHSRSFRTSFPQRCLKLLLKMLVNAPHYFAFLETARFFTGTVRFFTGVVRFFTGTARFFAGVVRFFTGFVPELSATVAPAP